MLSIQEVNFYNSLVQKNLAGKINCPFYENDIVVSRVNSQEEVYFECLTCRTTFHPGINVENIIKTTIDKFKNQG